MELYIPIWSPAPAAIDAIHYYLSAVSANADQPNLYDGHLEFDISLNRDRLPAKGIAGGDQISRPRRLRWLDREWAVGDHCAVGPHDKWRAAENSEFPVHSEKWDRRSG